MLRNNTHQVNLHPKGRRQKIDSAILPSLDYGLHAVIILETDKVTKYKGNIVSGSEDRNVTHGIDNDTRMAIKD